MMLHNPVQKSKAPDGRASNEQPKWRRDFPIDAAQDEYVARRDFVKFLVLTSAAFVAGQFWIVVQNFIRNRHGRLPVRPIAKLDDVPVGGAISFRYPDPYDPCILVRTDKTTLRAFGQKCTHLSCAVLPDVEKREFVCPCHDGVFDMMTGRPIAGPPRRPLPEITVKLRNGVIYATGVALRT